jgi:hypothetical protein
VSSSVQRSLGISSSFSSHNLHHAFPLHLAKYSKTFLTPFPPVHPPLSAYATLVCYMPPTLPGASTQDQQQKTKQQDQTGITPLAIDSWLRYVNPPCCLASAAMHALSITTIATQDSTRVPRMLLPKPQWVADSWINSSWVDRSSMHLGIQGKHRQA